MDRPVRHRRQHLGAVADAFLPAAGGLAAGSVAPPRVYAAAPGNADTSLVLASLNATPPSGGRDLGSGIGVRLQRLEQGGGVESAAGETSVLIWCPRGEEGLALMAAMALGRLAALIRPERIAVLWFAGGGAPRGREPAPEQLRKAASLARAAAPAAPVSLHCLGWTADARRQLDALAGRFRPSF